jgi:hypothetical protein
MKKFLFATSRMRKLLLSLCAGLSLCASAQAAVMNIGILEMSPGVPPPYIFDPVASGINSVSTTGSFGSWLFDVNATSVNGNLVSSWSIIQTDNTKEDILVMDVRSLGLDRGSTYTSLMNWVGTLPANFDVYWADYSAPFGSPYYDNGLALYSAGGPVKITAAGAYLFGAIDNGFGACILCGDMGVMYVASHPIIHTPLPAAALLFGSALAGLGLLGRRKFKHAAVVAD